VSWLGSLSTDVALSHLLELQVEYGIARVEAALPRLCMLAQGGTGGWWWWWWWCGWGMITSQVQPTWFVGALAAHFSSSRPLHFNFNLPCQQLNSLVKQQSLIALLYDLPSLPPQLTVQPWAPG
jgi:hypothetical protein